MPTDHSQRLLIVAATFELAAGIALFDFPGAFVFALYAPITLILPRLAALFLAGGILLLIAVRYKPAAWVCRALSAAAVVPLLIYVSYILQSGGYVGGVTYLILACGVVAAPWTRSINIFALTFGVAQLAIGLMALSEPFLVLSPSFEALRPIVPVVGLVGMAGSGLVLLPFLRRPLPPWAWQIRGIGVLVLPAVLIYTYWRSGTWTGVIMWLTWLVAALVESHPLLTGRLTDSPAESRNPDEAWAASSERSVEIWSWSMTLFVVVLTFALEPSISIALPRAVLFTLLVGGYNVIVCWLMPPWATPLRRLFLQLTVLAIGTSLLNAHDTVIASLTMPALMAIPMVAARAGGRVYGYWLLALVVAAMPLGHLAIPWSGWSLAEHPNLIVQTITLGVVGLAGVWISTDQRRLYQELAQTSVSLEHRNTELSSLNEELNAQSEQLLAQQDELMRQHRILAEQSLVLSSQRDELLESESRFRAAFENAPIGVVLVGLDLVIMRANPALHTMLRYGPGELTGMSVLKVTHDEDVEAARPLVRALLSGHSDAFAKEVRYFDRDGQPVWTAAHVAIVRDVHHNPLYYVAQVMDITERRNAERQLRRLANYDPLTGLANRRLFQTEIESALTVEGSYGALYFIDLDQFKCVNDTLGHQAGDELLRSLAQVLELALHDRGQAARLGGDEFGILIDGVDGRQAEEVAQELVLAVRSHLAYLGDHAVGVTASIGVALYPEHGRTVDELMLHADLAMYQAKNGGRNRSHVYTPDLTQREMDSRLDWGRRIREALAEDRFTLQFQPILDLKRNEVTLYEALLRMVDPSGGLIMPGEFLSAAEASGLIHEIDRWVVQRSIATIAEQQAKGRSISLSVNLSAHAFTDGGLLPLIKTGIEAHRINPAQLRFEITESAAIDDLDAAARFISALVEIGCDFAVDDFGAGFSSLTYLKRLPVGYLKIDGDFIERLPQDPVDQSLVRAMVTMARRLGLRTVAEYVGSAETVALLRQCGVDAAQGFHIGQPGPLPE